MVISSRLYAQIRIVLPALKNQSEENIGIWFYLKLKRIKIDFISYLSIYYVVLSRGIQYEMNDYSSAQESQRESLPSVKTLSLGFLSVQGGQTAPGGRSDRVANPVKPPVV